MVVQQKAENLLQDPLKRENIGPAKKKTNWLNAHFPHLNATANTIYRALCIYGARGSWQAWRRFLHFHFRSRRPYPAPPFLTIAPTYACVCQCVHCGVQARMNSRRHEMTTEQIRSVIDQARELGVLQITFTGGEPLLREDLVELITYAHDHGFLTRINTSGILLDALRVSRLKRAGLSQCAVSIDDADPNVHDLLRGYPGAFARAVQGIENLKKYGIPCQINTYAAKRNVPRGLEAIIALGRRLGVLAVYIILPTSIGRWEDASDELLNEEEKAKVRALQETTFVHLELATANTLCGIYKKMILFVSSTGDVTPCPFVAYPFGNISDLRLEQIWRLHCQNMGKGLRGDCPMNIREDKEYLRKHVARVAQSFNS
jgi:MoaA/NifB/PqqE/SkfB family radical SAM enzyme